MPVGTFGRPGGAAGQDDDRGLLGGFGGRVLAAAGDQFGQCLVGAAGRRVRIGIAAQPPQVSQRRLGHLHRFAVFVVVDDDLGALARGDVADLRSGELGVEQDDPSPHPGDRVVGDQEPAVVASQDRDPVTALHPHREQSVGHRIGRVVEFGEGQRPLVVDDRGPVRGPARVQRGDHADLTPPADVTDHPDDVLRGLESERAGLDHLLQVVQFRRTPFSELMGLTQSLGQQIIEHATNTM